MPIQVTSTTDAPEKPKAETTPKESQANQAAGGAGSAPEKTTHEQNNAEESDTTATEETQDEQEGDDAGNPESKEADSIKDKPKKKGGFQRRIDKLNARTRSIEEERDYWRTQALQKKEAGDTKTQSIDKPKTQEGRPNPDSFETHAEYVDALTDWKIETKEATRKADEAKSKLETEQQTLLKTHADRVKLFAQKTEDFHEALDAVDDIPVSATLQETIISSDHGPELMYELAKNRKEYERIAALPPLACARELGKIEARFVTAASSESKTQEPNKITKAPKPIEPVGKNNKGVVHKSIDDPNLSQSEYEQLRREQMKRKQA